MRFWTLKNCLPKLKSMGDGSVVQSSEPLVSEWYNRSNIDRLIKIVGEGDLLEFDRKKYKHWAVAVGLKELDGRKVFCVIHRAAPPGLAETGGAVFLGSVHSTSAASKRSGFPNSEDLQCLGNKAESAVRLEPLIDILGNDKVRINNRMDLVWTPFPTADIVARAEAEKVLQAPYNTVSNNCEHMAMMCRYGKHSSWQVETVMLTLAAASVIVAPAAAVLVGTAATIISILRRR